MSRRELARYHRQRLKEKRKHYWGYGSVSPIWDLREMPDEIRARVADTPKPQQGCLCCTNPRRLLGNAGGAKTRQELVSDIEMQEQLEDLGLAT